jgi:hypothetical protein
VKKKSLSVLVLIITALIPVISSCTGATSSTTPAPTAVYSSYELVYQLLSVYPDYFWCDPDLYPVAREGQEQVNALARFDSIRENKAEFAAILKQTGLPTQADYTDDQKLTIYREDKKLTRIVSLTPEGNHYIFSIRTKGDPGKEIEGSITSHGVIKILSERDSFNTCPICLAGGTLIASPTGEIAVEILQPGMTVWSPGSNGRLSAVKILKTSQSKVGKNSLILEITLADGRSLTASPEHPSAEYRPLADYRAGDELDGSVITDIAYISYKGEVTFDLLPESPSGCYYANGILVGSTLFPD